jgi:hypothetical protein
MELTIFVMNEQINLPHLYSSKVGREHHAGHLLWQQYKKKTRKLFQWTGKVNYPMELLTFIWDYDNRTVNLSMPGYVQAAALHKFQHTMPNCRQDAQYKINPPQYGANKSITHR